MKYEVNEIITLTDSREFEIINAVTINETEYLYLKNTEIDQYTIVKVIEDTIYNLNTNEIKLVIDNLYRSRWAH